MISINSILSLSIVSANLFQGGGIEVCEEDTCKYSTVCDGSIVRLNVALSTRSSTEAGLKLNSPSFSSSTKILCFIACTGYIIVNVWYLPYGPRAPLHQEQERPMYHRREDCIQCVCLFLCGGTKSVPFGGGSTHNQPARAAFDGANE